MNKKRHLKLEHVVLLMLLNGNYFSYIKQSFHGSLTSSEEPDAVFFQEVVPIAFDFIRNLLPEYNSYAG